MKEKDKLPYKNVKLLHSHQLHMSFLFSHIISNVLIMRRSRVSWLKVKVAQLCATLWDPMDYIVHGILQARILEWVAFPFSRGSSQPRDRNQVSRVAGNSLSAEPQGKPKSTGVGSLSLLQWIFPTQQLNWGLLHCRRIVYQLSYQGILKNSISLLVSHGLIFQIMTMESLC